LSTTNVYNACENSDTLNRMRELWALRHLLQNDNNASNMVWVGDFNRHHLLWDDHNNTHLFTATNMDAASVLINLVETFGMDMPLPAGIPTLKTFRTGSLS